MNVPVSASGGPISDEREREMFKRAEMRWMSVEDSEITVSSRDLALVGRELFRLRAALDQTATERFAAMSRAYGKANKEVGSLRAVLTQHEEAAAFETEHGGCECRTCLAVRAR